MKKITPPLIFILALFFSGLVYSKEEQSNQTVNYALGLNAGWVVGNGILFRMYKGKDIYQGTFVGMVNKDSKEAYLNTSVSYAHYLNRFDYKTPIGLKWVAGGEGVYDDSNNVSNNRINFGAGIGVDIGRVSREGIIISADLIYTLSFKGIRNPEFNALSLKPSVGIAYNF